MGDVTSRESPVFEQTGQPRIPAARLENQAAAPADALEYHTPDPWLAQNRRAGIAIVIAAAMLVPIVLALGAVLVIILVSILMALVSSEGAGILFAQSFGFAVICVPFTITVRAEYRLFMAARKLLAGDKFPLEPLIGNLRLTTGLTVLIAALCLVGFATELAGLFFLLLIGDILLGAGLVIAVLLLNRLRIQHNR